MSRMDKRVNCKIRIRYGKLFTRTSKAWNELRREQTDRTIPIRNPISEYKRITNSANIYFVIEDRVFFSDALNRLHKITPNKTKEALIEHILQGIEVSEHQIQPITLTYPDAKYIIGDFMEIVAAFGEKEDTNEDLIFNNNK